MAISTHNKYVSIPDWFSSSSSTPVTTVEKPTNVTNVYYGGGGGTAGITEIPIDNKTIVWLDLVITVPIDNDKIIINTEGKITTSGTTGVWELRQLTDGTNYIYTTYPVVTQLGVTMYADTDGLDLGSIYDGLPIDGTTIYWDTDAAGNRVLKAVGGGGTAESVAWSNITGKPSWIGSSKPTYSYSEIQNTPDLSKYALQTALDTTVNLTGEQTISGKKNFTTGGLFVNGSQIKYDSTKKYWKLEGDLLVTGGITMYGNEGTYTPSTIMDAIAVDGTTISKSGGVLKVIGGTGGGSVEGLSSVAYSGKYDDLIGKPTLLSSFTDDIVSGKYLPLSGGTLTGDLKFQENWGGMSSILRESLFPAHIYRLVWSTNGDVYDHYYNNNYSSSTYTSANLRVKANDGYLTLRFCGDGTFTWNGNKIWHEGNDGSGSGLDADLLDGKHADSFMNFNDNTTYVGASMGNDNLSKLASGDGHIEFWDNAGGWFNGKWGKLIAVSGFEGSLSGNASSATKLQTARTIWGQNFDGTANVSGDLSSTGHIISSKHATYDVGNNLISYRYGYFQWVGSNSGATFILGANNAYHIYINTSGNVGIGTASPQQKLHVVGNIWSSGDVGAGAKIHAFGNLIANGRAGIGLENPTTKLHVLESSTHTAAKFETYATQSALTITKRDGISWALGVGIKDNGDSFGWWTTTGQKCVASIDVSGNFWVNGGITMYSDQRKKTILNHVELSLKQIANAPLIEHYYNGDEKKTTHVSSIAQYWANMNNWFCKLDSEGFYTMEIQNAALASAISIARELDRYETKTDKAIKNLKKRICELEEEVERLKSA